jgi:hypothetical protein
MIRALLLLTLLAQPALAQLVDYEPGNEPPAGTFDATPPVHPFAPVAVSADAACPPMTNLAPAFQPSYSGIYQSLTAPNHQLLYLHAGNTLQVTLLLGDGSWATGEITIPNNRRELLLPLYQPGSSAPVGQIKLCSSTFSVDRPSLCTNIHARAVIAGKLVFPVSAAHAGCGPGNTTCLQRFAAKELLPGTTQGPCN